MTTTSHVKPDRVRPGDIADHKSGTLDPRPVAEVDHQAGTVRLDILGHITDPLPLANYTFRRHTEAASRA